MMHTLLLVILAVAVAHPTLAATFFVDCDTFGRTITKALRVARPSDTIRVSGTCEETVTITTDRITLDGGGDAVLQGAGGGQAGDVPQGLLNIVGAQGVVIRGFTVRHSPVDGINGRQGAAFTLHHITVLDSADDGIEVAETSTAQFLGSCEVLRSGEFGITIIRNSHAMFNGEHVEVAQNRTGILVTGASRGTIQTGTISATNNTSFGIVVQETASVVTSRLGPTVITEANGLDGILVVDNAHFRHSNGTLTASQNGRSGLRIGGSGLTIAGGTVLLEHNAEGLGAFTLARVTHFPPSLLTIQGNTTGMRGDEGSNIRSLAGTTITGNGTDVVLSFGTVAAFVGTTIGTLTCDETVLLRGDTGVTCPTP